MPGLIVNGRRFNVEELSRDGTAHTISVDGNSVSIDVLKETRGELLVRVENKILRLTIPDTIKDPISLRLNGRHLSVSLELVDSSSLVSTGERVEGPLLITAPMSGRIVSVKVGIGSKAEEGQAIVVLEAMKMENEIASPRSGTVKEIFVQPGTLVKAGDKLAQLE